MPRKNASRMQVSLDDDWLVAFDDKSHNSAPSTPEPDEPRPAPRRGRRPRRVEASGDDWLEALDQSRDTPRERARRTPPRPVHNVFENEESALIEHGADDPSHRLDDEPGPDEHRNSWLARLRQRVSRTAAIGAGSLIVGLVAGLALRPASAPPPPSSSGAAPAVIVDRAPRELVVAPGGGEGVFTSLAEAIRKATPGQRVRIKPGTYQEAVVVDKAVEILGDGQPSDVVIEADNGPVVLIQAETASLRGVTVRAKKVANSDQARGIDVQAGRVLIEDVTIEGSSAVGLVVAGKGTAPVVRRVVVRGTSGYSLVVADSAGGFFEGCQFVGATTSGVLVVKDARAILRDCEIRPAAGSGVLVLARGDGTLVDCRLLGGAKCGASVTEGGRVRLLDGEIAGFGAEGVLVGKEGEASLEGVRVHGNTRAGIAARAGGRVSIRRCNLADNKGGEVDAEPGCSVLADAPRPQAPDRPPTAARLPEPSVQPTHPPVSVRPGEEPSVPPEPPPDFDGYRNIPAPT